MQEITGKERSLSDLTRVRLTNLDKVMYPAISVTKQEVITYYIRMAPRILPFLRNRPLTLHRFPGGVGGEAFYEKDAPQGTPDLLRSLPILTGLRTAISIMSCATTSTHSSGWQTSHPWNSIPRSLPRLSYDSPDLLLFDIDPEPPLTFDDVIDVAHLVREHLENAGIRSFVKTSGKKGVHIVVPLSGGHRFEEVRAFAHTLGKTIARDSSHVVAEFARSRDTGTIFIDYLQNARGKTMAAPYSLRATASATVSAPISWENLIRGIRPEDFNIRTMLSGSEDPWRGIFDTRQTIGR